jgi:hypothetical protein
VVIPKARKAPAPTETQVHLQIADYVRRVGFGRGVVAIHIRGERAGASQRLTAWKMGAVSGVPDWLVIAYGTPIFIELKKLGWRAGKARNGTYNAHEQRQLAVHEQLRLAGATVEIAETLDEFLALLSRHHVPVRKVDDESSATKAIRRGALKALNETTEKLPPKERDAWAFARDEDVE